METTGEIFTDNTLRLAGLHRLSQLELSKLTGISKQTISRWAGGSTDMPSMKSALRVSQLFEVDAGRLTVAFVENLSVVADPLRFERVEQKIRRSKTPLRAVSN